MKQVNFRSKLYWCAFLLSGLSAAVLLAACSGSPASSVPAASSAPAAATDSSTAPDTTVISSSPAVDIAVSPAAAVTPPASSVSSSAATPAGTPATGVKITMTRDPSTVNAGDTFQLSVNIDSTTTLRGAQWALSFDPQAMQLQKINEGDFFKNWAKSNNGTTMEFPEPKIDNTAGKVSDMGIAVMASAAGGATGQGTLCTYIFKALSATLEDPHLSGVILVNQSDNTLIYTDAP